MDSQLVQRYTAPILAIVLCIVIFVLAVVNLPQTSGIFDRSVDAYFIKPIELNRLYVVEPNLEGYMNEKVQTPDENRLYDALKDLRQRYVIDKTEMTEVNRNGIVMPNLLVYVHPDHQLQKTVDTTAGRSSTPDLQ